MLMARSDSGTRAREEASLRVAGMTTAFIQSDLTPLCIDNFIGFAAGQDCNSKAEPAIRRVSPTRMN